MSFSSYDSSNIKVLKGLEAVKKRPGMYIGDVNDGSGLHHMVFELIDNSIDESIAGFCKNIEVTLYNDNSVSVFDDGRGIPTEYHKEEKMSSAELIMTVLHAGAKFDNMVYKISGGLHGVGLSVVNALSEKLELKIYRKGLIYYQKYNFGIPDNNIKIIDNTNLHGTYIRFWPDKNVFTGITKFKYLILFKRLNELSYFNSGLKIKLIDLINNKSNVFLNNGGIKSYLSYLCKDKKLVHKKKFYFFFKNKKIYLEVVCQWLNEYKENIYCFTNNIYQINGGTHLSGFKSAVTRTINNYISKNLVSSRKKKISLIGEDVRMGLYALVSIKISNPNFSSQMKDKLISSNIKSLVESLVSRYLLDFLVENDKESKLILYKIINSYKIRESSRKLREISKKKNILENSLVCAKLASCQEKNPLFSEIFLVEGDSAGGSAKQGRNRINQAVLPLKGKILNVEKSSLDKILSSKEISSLIVSLGCGIICDNFNINKLKYHTIIIMTDADVDGAHIRTLLLTFFYRYMKDLIINGHLYVAQPPLFRLKRYNKEYYVNNKKDFLKKKLLLSFKDVNLYNKNNELIINTINLVKYSYLYIKIYNLLFNKEDILLNYFLNELMFFDKIILLNNESHIIWLKKFLFNLNKNIDLNKNEFFGKLFYDDKKMINFIFYKKDNYFKKNILLNNFFLNNHYNDLFELGKKLYFFRKKIDFFIFLNKKKYIIKDFYYLINLVQKKTKKKIFIQRYKGLGEMNPDQLWKTTMDPKNRLMLKISIKDVIKADNLFKILMGEDVKSRKNFIEKNYINIINIDT